MQNRDKRRSSDQRHRRVRAHALRASSLRHTPLSCAELESPSAGRRGRPVRCASGAAAAASSAVAMAAALEGPRTLHCDLCQVGPAPVTSRCPSSAGGPGQSSVPAVQAGSAAGSPRGPLHHGTPRALSRARVSGEARCRSSAASGPARVELPQQLAQAPVTGSPGLLCQRLTLWRCRRRPASAARRCCSSTWRGRRTARPRRAPRRCACATSAWAPTAARPRRPWCGPVPVHSAGGGGPPAAAHSRAACSMPGQPSSNGRGGCMVKGMPLRACGPARRPD